MSDRFDVILYLSKVAAMLSYHSFSIHVYHIFSSPEPKAHR